MVRGLIHRALHTPPSRIPVPSERSGRGIRAVYAAQPQGDAQSLSVPA
jgi:hypothetical protein